MKIKYDVREPFQMNTNVSDEMYVEYLGVGTFNSVHFSDAGTIFCKINYRVIEK